MASESTTATAVLEQLRAAADRLETIDAEIESVGQPEVEQVASVHAEFESLLGRYESTATGTGRDEFQSFVEFEGELAEFEERLADDLPRVEAFEEACELLDRRRLEEQDFERAREALDPATEVADLLDEREEALRSYREARSRVASRIEELDAEIEELEETLSFADVDFETDLDPIGEPIETYNTEIRDAVQSFLRTAPARDVLSFLETTESYPLVSFPRVPADLRAYVFDHEVGSEPLPTLREYADFSMSKLEHYVDDPREFRTAVGGNRTYLNRLDAEPLTIEWPPPGAVALRRRIEELVPVVGRIASEDVVATLRAVRDMTRDDRFETLREVAIARERLDAAERERLRSGAVESELAARREERTRLEDALSRYPER